MGANPALAGLVVSVMRRPVAVVMSGAAVVSISLLVDDAGPGATLRSISVSSSTRSKVEDCLGWDDGMRPARRVTPDGPMSL
jgi:hypothetical protein